jgi:hypothetical protein
MARISVTGAAFAGLGVIGRHPGAVLTWGVVLLVLSVLPVLALVAIMGPQMLKILPGILASERGAIDQEVMREMMRLQSGMLLLQLVGWLWGTFVKALICSAVFRAVLQPDASRRGFLRLGAQELWLTLLFLVVSVLAYIVVVIASIGVMLPAFIVGLTSGAQGQGAAAGFVTALALGLVVTGVLIWLGLRLSMAAPMTFADSQFRLFESWSFTKGSAWRLLGMSVLSLLLVFVVELVVAAIVLGAMFAAGGPPVWWQDPKAIEAFVSQPPLNLLRQIWPWLAVGGAVWTLLGAGLFTLFCAPWAAAYKDLIRPASAEA